MRHASLHQPWRRTTSYYWKTSRCLHNNIWFNKMQVSTSVGYSQAWFSYDFELNEYRNLMVGGTLKDVRTHCYCASLLRTQIHTPRHASRARAKQWKWTIIGKMAIATALRGFNDLGHLVSPTFLSRNRYYLRWSTHCSKMKKTERGKWKKFQGFCPRDIESCHPDCKVRETMVAKFKLVL